MECNFGFHFWIIEIQIWDSFLDNASHVIFDAQSSCCNIFLSSGPIFGYLAVFLGGERSAAGAEGQFAAVPEFFGKVLA